MKPLAFAGCLLWAAIFSTDAWAAIEAPQKTLPVGERLVFDVYWMGIPVGEGSLEIAEIADHEGRQAYHLAARARTNDFLSKLYPVTDEIHSWMDTKELYSLEFRKDIREGKYRADERILYDYRRGQATYESYWNKSKKTLPLVKGAHDFLSCFYWFRLQDIAIGQNLRAVINSAEKNWDLELKVLKIEVKELRGGRVLETVMVEPKTKFKGVLYKRGRAWVCFSTDARRLPVWIALSTPFGRVVGVLREHPPVVSGKV